MQIIMIKGAIETLEFFSMQMARTFEERGFDVWFWDMKTPFDSREAFEQLNHPEDSVLVTFNFIGLSGESQFAAVNGKSIWDYYGISVYCILVDHPMYYYKNLIKEHRNLTILCVDRDHKCFVEEYYPKYRKVYFLPLAGTELAGEKIPYAQRDIDIIFAGNYVPQESLLSKIAGVEEEIRQFYFDIVEELIGHPDISMEQELIGRLKREFPEITKEELLSSMYHMVFIDLYIRTYFRRKIICSLAEKGYRVLVIGKDWDKAQCQRPENLAMSGQLDSLQCLQYMRNAKIAVNIMPWFKDGAHDRIFNAMLQGCAVVTDTSRYLDEEIQDGVDYVAFSLEQTEQISQKIQYLLDHPMHAQKIAEAGYHKAGACHTWAQRAEDLLEIIENEQVAKKPNIYL